MTKYNKADYKNHSNRQKSSKRMDIGMGSLPFQMEVKNREEKIIVNSSK